MIEQLFARRSITWTCYQEVNCSTGLYNFVS